MLLKIKISFCNISYYAFFVNDNKKTPCQKRQGAISFRLSASRFRLVGNVGKESKMTCAFDSGGQLALMACAGSGYSSGNDFASFREESSETGNIFVIDFSDFIYAESTNSFAASAVTIHGSFRSFHDYILLIDFQSRIKIELFAQKGRSSSSTTVKSSAEPAE